MWADAVARISAGEVVVVDEALGFATAAGALADVKSLLHLGRLRGDNVSAAIGPVIYRAMPRLWDSYRLIALMKTDDVEAEAQGQNPMMVLRDGKGRGVFPYLLEAKGVDHPDIDVELDKICAL